MAQPSFDGGCCCHDSPTICEVSHLYETHAGKDKEGDYPQKGAQMRADLLRHLR